MDRQTLIETFQGLTVWSRNGQRAPHKPLLALLALGYLQREGRRELPFTETDQQLKALLADVGPPRRKLNPQYPFYFLQFDGVWEFAINTPLELPLNPSAPSARVMREWGVSAGFTEAVFQTLQRDPEAVRAVANLLLAAHFPPTYHEDILQAVGLDLELGEGAGSATRVRDPKFRHEVLTAYGYRCAVCGLKIEMQDKTVAIEAAHIKWHQAGGPDHTANGLALCTLHHKLFDVGAFTLSGQLQVAVSSMAHGNDGFQRWLLDFNGAPITQPAMPDWEPERDFLDWHVREVFKGQGRYALDLEAPE